MKRISLILAGALARLLLASVGTAAAMPAEGLVNSECNTSSKNVIGNKVTVIVTGRNVPQSQMKFAQCKVVKKVAHRLVAYRYETPKTIEGFRCTSTLVSGKAEGEPRVVKYKCLLGGAESPAELRLNLKVSYNTD